MIYTRLLEKLTLAHGVSGNEGEIRDLIQSVVLRYADEVTTDALGNLIVHKRGDGPKVMLAAHMDGVGAMITHYEKEGVLRFAPVGGLDPASVLQAPVRFQNGVKGLISCDDNKVGKELKFSDLLIDIGAKDGEEAKKMVSLGDTAAFCTPFMQVGDRVIAPYLDNRAGCAVLIGALKTLSQCKNDLYFVFTAQEEVGSRGAEPVAYAVRPDYALIVDVTCPDDIPGPLHEGTTAVGKGAAIKVMDHSVISSPVVVEKLNQLAVARGITVQNDVLLCGGTDGGPIHRSRTGVLTGGVSVPCRYTHAPTELIDLGDLNECVRLVAAFCESEL